jgi:imidazolonepropionase-like amidohydrolase
MNPGSLEGHNALIPEYLWDGESDEAEKGLAVVVKSGRIADIVAAGEVPNTMPRQEFPGCTLIPGLIDAHVHYATSFGPLFLAAGVTTVRDTGNDLDWILAQRDANLNDSSRGPRILCTGWALDGTVGIWNYIVRRHPDADSLRASIREHVERGVDQIKLYASIREDLMRVGVEEAHAHGKFILAHLNETSAEKAAELGLNEIEHFSRCDVAWRDATEVEDDQLIDLLKGNGVIMNPTLNVWDRLGRAVEHVFLNDVRLRWMHPQLLDIWERFPYRQCDPADRMRFQKVMPHLKRFLLRCHEKGAIIAAGTDTPFINLIPGFGLHDELAQYVDAGLRPVDALRAATSTNARVIGVADEVGRIKRGLAADLVAVEGNPLDRIDDLGNIRTVFRNGQALEAEALLDAARGYFDEKMDGPIIQALTEYVSGEMPKYRQKGGE